MSDETIVRQILELARWAPSGDNTQPWRFEIVSTEHVVVHGFDTRDRCVYDLDGHPSQISIGALLETIAIAATRFGLRTEATRRQDQPEERPLFDVRFRKEHGLEEDDLVDCITQRRVQRRPLSTRPLSGQEKSALERSVAPHFQLRWFDGWPGRARVAWLAFRSAKLRLTLPEAYRVHRDVIEWRARESEDRIPDAALGASPPTLALMRWAMASWERVNLLNRYLGGTIAPRIELDLLPGLACAAHCALIAPGAPDGTDDYVRAGRALQRFWLTATRLGLQFQPEYTPLVFARYAREARTFTKTAGALRRAHAVREATEGLLDGNDAQRAVFIGRIGSGPAADARSTRLPLETLIVEGSALEKGGAQAA